MEFFTAKDLFDLASVAGRPYNSADQDHRASAQRIKTGVWDKTGFWAKAVQKRLAGFTVGFKRVWIKQGHQQALFKHYTWARIFRENDAGREVYFTVGIDVDRESRSVSLLYKLDYEESRSGKLSPLGRVVCARLIKDAPGNAVHVSLTQGDQLSWDSLIEETAKFIESKIDLYDQVIREAWRESHSHVARLAWNTAGWVMPSGRKGKSSDEKSHEGLYGYGHEEWLLDSSKIIDGYHYGFLEPIRKNQARYQGNLFNIWFYTINLETKKRYWIGAIRNIEAIMPEEAQRVDAVYAERGWRDEMEQQLADAGVDAEGTFSGWRGADLFNVKFRICDVEINDPYFELDSNHPIRKITRYTLAAFRLDFQVEKSSAIPFEFINRQKLDSDSVGLGSAFRDPPLRTVEVVYLHRMLSAKLNEALSRQYGPMYVTEEHPAGYNDNRIDIVVKDQDGKHIFYEIKAYNSPLAGIREAFGQLIEYAYWPNSERAKELIIVTPGDGKNPDIRQYMSFIRDRFKIPVYYQALDLESGGLSEKL